jgi:hypothetical protein
VGSDIGGAIGVVSGFLAAFRLAGAFFLAAFFLAAPLRAPFFAAPLRAVFLAALFLAAPLRAVFLAAVLRDDFLAAAFAILFVPLEFHRPRISSAQPSKQFKATFVL